LATVLGSKILKSNIFQIYFVEVFPFKKRGGALFGNGRGNLDGFPNH
jgi:hypothetical protein